MSREEAIEELTNTLEYMEWSGDKSCVLSKETIELAMSALSNKGDLISRQAVFNTLENADKFLDEERTVDKYKELLTECIKVLPSAENKREWIDNGNGSYTCSNCKIEWTTSQIEKMCFCPTCGADMREPKGERGNIDQENE